ncbi:chalcone isomerase-like protein 2 [Bidens hawaiensis]|uniref:chalcone isomerase-like protein 2 n=1 Tax=Bidens hawaiensis TaxID=980011 RepID=UPI00404B7D19
MMIVDDNIPFPPQITTTKPLSLLGHGITNIVIHFLQVKLTAISVYIDPQIVSHLQKWKGKSGTKLAEDDDFFDSVISGSNSCFKTRDLYAHPQISQFTDSKEASNIGNKVDTDEKD